MSKDKGGKDKGGKNQKKAPADKSSGKTKVVSAYKSEGKGGSGINPTLDVFVPKTDSKSDGKRKS
jgi:hypothetical protein